MAAAHALPRPHKRAPTQRSKLPPVPHAAVSTGQLSPFPDTVSLLSFTHGSKSRGSSARAEHLAVNQLLHDREAEPRSRHQLRALAKKRVADVLTAQATSTRALRVTSPVEAARPTRYVTIQRRRRAYESSWCRYAVSCHSSGEMTTTAIVVTTTTTMPVIRW